MYFVLNMGKVNMSVNAEKINVMHLRCSFKTGGIEKLILTILEDQELAKNVEHTLVILKDESHENLEKYLESINCKLYKIKNSNLKDPRILVKLLGIIRENNIDLIHTNDKGGMRFAAMCKLAKPDVKLVHTVHDYNEVQKLGSINSFIVKNLIDKNIAISKSIQAEFSESSIYNTIQIYNGIDTKKFRPDAIRRHEQKELKIVNLAWLRLPKKGQDVLIQALGECKKRGVKFSCDLIGGVYDQTSFERIRELVTKNDLQKELRFLGVKDKIPQVLQDYNLFVFPSRKEGLPLALLEAMAAGLPVIASDINSSNEVISHEQNGLLFENENPVALADRITELYHNPEKRGKLAKEGLDYVRNFDTSIMLKKYYDLYRKLV